jgi:hypothetical protein
LLFEMIVAPFGTANSRWERCRKHPLLPPMPPDDLLSALLDDIAWPAATLRLEFNHLDPLKEACSEDPVLLGKVVKQRLRMELAGQSLTDPLD